MNTMRLAVGLFRRLTIQKGCVMQYIVAMLYLIGLMGLVTASVLIPGAIIVAIFGVLT